MLLLLLHLSGNSLRISEICVCALKFELLMRIVVNLRGGAWADNTHIYGDIE